jgi:hypothetical protein
MSATEKTEKASYDEDTATNEKPVELSKADHARILRKLDTHLLPFVSLLYLLSFLYVDVSCPAELS